MREKKAVLALEDGSFYQGLNFGDAGTRSGELVFNTSMSGYQEIITDPSYYGQMVLFTYPLIGNYGVNRMDSESAGVHAGAVVVREYSPVASGPRCEGPLDEFLARHGVVGIAGVDTREITLKIRRSGTMRAVVSTEEPDGRKLALRAAEVPPIEGRDLVKEVSCREPYAWNGTGRLRVAVLDCGVKFSTLRELEKRNCRVEVFPADSGADCILSSNPGGIIISNGPGDPLGVPYVIETVKRLAGKAPLFGICFGHQILALALGGKTSKLKFGHHGGNHPVRELETGKVLITAQNHNFCVREDCLPDGVRLTHVNLYDGTVEGFRHRDYPAFSVQFHPEAGPGPNDARHLFDNFTGLMGGGKCRSEAT